MRGRIRFQVFGLYRSPRLKKRLEEETVLLAGVRSAEANILTGKLLISYAPRTMLADVLACIESVLDDVVGPCLDAAAVRPVTGRATQRVVRRKPLSAAVSNALNEFTSMIRGFSSPFTTLDPVMAAANGAAALVEGGGKLVQEIQPWHTFELSKVVETLGTSDQTGLTAANAGERLRLYGENSLTAAKKRSDLSIFLEQFNNLPVGLLAVSALVALLTGGMIDAAVIIGVIMINGVIGFVTERQAEKAIASLASTGVREVSALRDGEVILVSVETIVPGDVLLLTPGTYIAADVRLVRSHRLSIDESALTGESMPVAKDHTLVAKDDTTLADRKNMGFMGTHVTGGNGRGVVICTAEATELGQIQTMVGEAEAPDTPMEKQLDRMGTQLAILSGAVCAGVFGIGILRGYAWLAMLKTSISLAVAAVPEGLPAVATTTLAMGIAEMRKRDCSVRHLDAVESLGSVQVFCMDKTGTLTQNRMAVVSVYGGGDNLEVSQGKFLFKDAAIDPMDRDELVRLMQVVSLCSEVEIQGTPKKYKLEGSATEAALVDMALDAGVDVPSLRNEYPKKHTRYRAEGRPYMSTFHTGPDGAKSLLAVKGSPDAVLALCDYQLKGGKRVKLTKPARDEIMAANDRMAGNALRVLGGAYREVDGDNMPEKTEKLTWLGLGGMADPMRPGMDKLIAKYHQAGIETIMITGDQSATAYAIGKQLGLSGKKPLQVLESSKLETMEPELLAGLAKNVHVFARVSPAHKLKIVRALQEAGFVVAMTGDGINDGPALKAADVGVAMGLTGTNVAREVSDVVLEDDNLHTMTAAVSQGRTIYNNIRKMIHFMVSTNLTEIEVMLIGVILNWGEVMNPMQLLWINLVTDIFPGLALSLEPPEPDIMERDPRDPDEAIIEGRDLKRMIFESGVIGVGVLGAFYYGMRKYGLGAAPATLAFNTLTMNELAHALSSRSKYKNVFGGQKLPPNKHLTRALVGTAVVQGLVSYLPAARRLLGTTPMGPIDLAVVAAGVVLPLIVNEATKPSYKPLKDQTESDAGAIQSREEEAA